VRDEERLAALPAPAIAIGLDGQFSILGGPTEGRKFRLINPLDFVSTDVDFAPLHQSTGGRFILVQRKFCVPGTRQTQFGFRWFLPSIWKYRGSLIHVLVASLLIQIFALVTPLFFQLVVDKVLA